jgi:LysR family transcriptional regulator, glycine cleavage system transcriptional activator
MRDLPPLSSLRAFEAAARHGGFKRAAQELSVTPTAVSHQIKTLEEHLGVRLFERKPRLVVLTDQGRFLSAVLRDGFDAIQNAVDHLRNHQRRPSITISATRAFVAKWLMPRVERFQRVLPGVDLMLHASDDLVDLHAGQADLAIRYGRGPYPGFLSSKLLEDHFAPVVNPSLGVRTPAHLARVASIAFEWQREDTAHPTWPMWFERAGLSMNDARPALRFNDESHAIQAAVAGQGAALLSLLLVKDECDAGRLVQPFGPTLPALTYHVLTAPRRADDEHVRTARDWLLDEAAR